MRTCPGTSGSNVCLRPVSELWICSIVSRPVESSSSAAASRRRATCSCPIKATSGASSGPWVAPVNAARSGLKSDAPLVRVAVRTAFDQLPKSGPPSATPRARARRNRDPMPRWLHVPPGSTQARRFDHVDERFDIAREQQVAAHGRDESMPVGDGHCGETITQPRLELARWWPVRSLRVASAAAAFRRSAEPPDSRGAGRTWSPSPRRGAIPRRHRRGPSRTR